MHRGAWWAAVHRASQSRMTEVTQHACMHYVKQEIVVYFGKIWAVKGGKVEDCYHDRHLPKHFSMSGTWCPTQKLFVDFGPRLHPSFPT